MLFADLSQQSDVNLICVQSEDAYQALFLLQECIGKQNGNQAKEIHWFCYDVGSKEIREELQIADSDNRYHFYICSPSTCSNKESLEINLSKEFESLRQKIEVPSKKLIVIIDSFSTLINENEVTAIKDIFREICLNRKSTNKSTIKFFLTLRENTSLNAATHVKHLRYLSNVWLTISNNMVFTKQKKSSGKISKQTYEYTEVNGKSSFTLVKKVHVPKSKSEKIMDDTVCSFKLDLTDQEKEARNAVQLPYLRNSDNNEKKVPETKIHYNPDEFDDWDEEDPDNDLEFV